MDEHHIRFLALIEVVGKPKEYVDQAIHGYVNDIKNNGDFVVLRETFADSIEKGKFWSTFVELELVVKNVHQLIAFCFDYMPASIDILKPEVLTFTLRDTNLFFNDLQSKLHMVDMVAKNRAAEIDFLKTNLKTMIENTIMIVLVNRAFSGEDLSNLLKIGKEEIQFFLDDLEKNNKIKKEGETYTLVHGKQGKD